MKPVLLFTEERVFLFLQSIILTVPWMDSFS